MLRTVAGSEELARGPTTFILNLYSHVLAVGSPLDCASQLLPQRVSCYMNVPSPPSCYSSSLLHHHSQAAAKKHARFCLITQQQLHAHVTAAVCSPNICVLNKEKLLPAHVIAAFSSHKSCCLLM